MYKKYYRENYPKINPNQFNLDKKKEKYYVVIKGRNIGIFRDKSYARKMVTGIKAYIGVCLIIQGVLEIVLSIYKLVN